MLCCSAVCTAKHGGAAAACVWCLSGGPIAYSLACIQHADRTDQHSTATHTEHECMLRVFVAVGVWGARPGLVIRIPKLQLGWAPNHTCDNSIGASILRSFCSHSSLLVLAHIISCCFCHQNTLRSALNPARCNTVDQHTAIRCPPARRSCIHTLHTTSHSTTCSWILCTPAGRPSLQRQKLP